MGNDTEVPCALIAIDTTQPDGNVSPGLEVESNERGCVMKKLGVFLVASIVCYASPAFALFQNGGFETGDLSGWTITYGTNLGNGAGIDWGSTPYGTVTPGVWTSSSTFPGQSVAIDPLNGQYSARINDLTGNYHATMISQTDTISQTDIDNGAKVYINWGAVLVEPFNAHTAGNQPFFGIDVTIGGTTVGHFFADALDKQGGGWTDVGTDVTGNPSGGTIWYKDGTWEYDLASYSAGTAVTVAMYVSDCGLGGHGGFALLDGVGTTYQPPLNTVPVPGALLLSGLGAGLARWIRRRGIQSI
jgi:hypothetical protein